MHYKCVQAARPRMSCHALIAPLQVYSGLEVADMAGHLMVYPYHVSETGAITYLGSEFLPDTKTAKVTRLQRSMHQHACRRGAIAAVQCAQM